MNTFSVKELTKKDKFSMKSPATSRRLLPELNRKEGAITTKFDNLKAFNFNNAFSPNRVQKSKIRKDDSELSRGRRSKDFQTIQIMSLDNRRPERLGLNLISPNSNSTSNLQTFMGSSPLRSRANQSNLKEINEHQSVGSSREVSLEQIDESNEAIPKGYITLRKSCQDKSKKDLKIKHKKSTFKVRKNRSGLRKVRATLLNNI